MHINNFFKTFNKKAKFKAIIKILLKATIIDI